MGPLHGQFAVGMVVGIGAFIEGHDDVRPKVFLDGDGFFGGEAMGGTVDVNS